MIRVTVLLGMITLVGSKIFSTMFSPEHWFGDKPVLAAPDYNLRAHWAAWPDSASPAERLPEGVISVKPSQRKAAAFFLHPTTFGSKEHLVHPMDNQRAAEAYWRPAKHRGRCTIRSFYG